MGMIVQSTVTVSTPQLGPLADAPELQVLAEYVRGGRCALFVGAGLSATCGLPTWAELMQRLMDRAVPYRVSRRHIPRGFTLIDDDDLALRDPIAVAARKALGARRFDDALSQWRSATGQRLPWALAGLLEHLGAMQDDHDELARLIDQKRFPELASACRAAMGQASFDAELARALQPTGGVSVAHRHIARTPYACVVTTNFDDLIERAHAERHGGSLPRAPTGTDLQQLGTLLMDGAFFVLKAHGDIRRPETLIFSADDYRRVIHAAPAFQAVFNTILMTHALLFVGYSLSDTNFRLMLDQQLTVFNGQVPPRYAILNGVGPVESDLLWRTSRLHVLSYERDQHENVEQALAVLADAGGRPAEPPEPPEPPARATRRRPPSPAARIDDAEPAALLTLAVRDGRLHASLADPSAGNSAGTSLAADQWVTPQALHELGLATRAAIRAHDRQRSATDEIAASGQALARCVAPPLLEWLQALPSHRALGLRCLDGMHTLPWEWLAVQGRPLCLTRPLRRVSSSLVDAARGRRLLRQPARALLIGDTGDGGERGLAPLPDSDREVQAVATMLLRHLPRRNITLLAGSIATRARILAELRSGQYDLVHFAGHAWIGERESHFFAWDEPILASQLTPALSAAPPALLVLSTHFTAFQPWGVIQHLQDPDTGPRACLADLAGLGSIGFAETAMRCGVGAFVGCFGEAPAEDTADAMIDFMAAWLRGEPADTALLEARQRAAERGRSTAQLFSLTGYRDLGQQAVQPPRSKARTARRRAP